MARLNHFSNAAGILTRILTVFDALRQVAMWFTGGGVGSGPLGVPIPAKASTPAPGPAPRLFGDSIKPEPRIETVFS